MKSKYTVVLLIFVFLGCVVLSRTLLDPTGRVVGDDSLAVWDHLWHFGWMKYSLSHGVSPFHTDMLFFPNGVNIFAEMPSILPPVPGRAGSLPRRRAHRPRQSR